MNVAIVVAGGKGLRFGGNRPKQFLELNAIPIIVHTLRQFERSTQIETVMVVLPPEETAAFLASRSQGHGPPAERPAKGPGAAGHSARVGVRQDRRRSK